VAGETFSKGRGEKIKEKEGPFLCGRGGQLVQELGSVGRGKGNGEGCLGGSSGGGRKGGDICGGGEWFWCQGWAISLGRGMGEVGERLCFIGRKHQEFGIHSRGGLGGVVWQDNAPSQMLAHPS